jgi:hypothetical protein
LAAGDQHGNQPNGPDTNHPFGHVTLLGSPALPAGNNSPKYGPFSFKFTRFSSGMFNWVGAKAALAGKLSYQEERLGAEDG